MNAKDRRRVATFVVYFPPSWWDYMISSWVQWRRDVGMWFDYSRRSDTTICIACEADPEQGKLPF